MRLAWLTDIHLNFVERPVIKALADTVRAARPDAVLLGGDIGEAASLLSYLEALSDLLRLPIYFVLGNHDYYRGSIAGVREAVARFITPPGGLTYLSAIGVVPLTARTALVGHDGWGDGGYGNAENSPVMLTDFWIIKDLAVAQRTELLGVLRRLGQEAAEHLRRVLPEALGRTNTSWR